MFRQVDSVSLRIEKYQLVLRRQFLNECSDLLCHWPNTEHYDGHPGMVKRAGPRGIVKIADFFFRNRIDFRPMIGQFTIEGSNRRVLALEYRPVFAKLLINIPRRLIRQWFLAIPNRQVKAHMGPRQV